MLTLTTSFISQKNPDALDKVGELRRQCSKFVQTVEATYAKCVSLTHGCGLAMWTEGIRLSCAKVKLNVLRLLRDAEPPADEWSLAQYALQTVEMVGELLSTMRDLDVTLTQKSLEATRTILHPGPWENYASYYLGTDSRSYTIDVDEKEKKIGELKANIGLIGVIR